MMRGRKPTPTGLKKLRCIKVKRPLQANLQFPGSELPIAPEFLSAHAKAEWDRVLGVLGPSGVVTALDMAPLAVYCETYATWKVVTELLAEAELTVIGANGHLVQNPLNRIASKAASDLVRFASEFGLTPVSRSRIPIGTSHRAEPSDEFFK